MKKVILSILIAICIQFNAFSQSCLPGYNNFTTQQQIDDFQINYPNCTEIEGQVVISGPDIYYLTGFNNITRILGDLYIEGNDNLNNLGGLNYLDYIGGSFNIQYNNSLTSVDGLGNLTTIGGTFNISDNNSLSNLTALQWLTSVGMSFTIQENSSLVSLHSLSNLDVVGGYFRIIENDLLEDLGSITNLHSLPDNLEIAENPNLINLDGFASLMNIGGNLVLVNNFALENIQGLEDLSSIGGFFDIANHYALTSLHGLESLTSINGYLEISGTAISDFSGLNSLTSINGHLQVSGTAISNFSGLEYLTSIGGNLEIKGNDVLESLTGLQNISTNSIQNLDIRSNHQLTECNIQSICNYLNNPTGGLLIDDNAYKCDDEQQVQLECSSASIESNSLFSRVSIYPNPASTRISIESPEIEIEEINIFNQLGQSVLHELYQSKTIDISSLEAGLYIVELKSGEYMIRRKLVVER
ncbi:T9SS type A sorting domain-containing protein [Bacteroidota bacterium]